MDQNQTNLNPKDNSVRIAIWLVIIIFIITIVALIAFYKYLPVPGNTRTTDQSLDNANNANSSLHADTDDDGLTDALELSIGLDPKTPNLDIDTDGDGVIDEVELIFGTDPNNPGDIPPPLQQ